MKLLLLSSLRYGPNVVKFWEYPKIEKIKKIIKIGLAFSCQKIMNIPLSKYDKKLDFIITEKEILKWEYCF